MCIKGEITVYVDSIRRVHAVTDLQTVAISECFRTIELRCRKTEDSDKSGILASVEDKDGNILLVTGSNWHCSSGDDNEDTTTFFPDLSRPVDDVLSVAQPIWSGESSMSAHCKSTENFLGEGKRQGDFEYVLQYMNFLKLTQLYFI